ncbi:MAG: hypothetical protein AAGB93_09825 [Planctomycetota bacterium]
MHRRSRRVLLASLVALVGAGLLVARAAGDHAEPMSVKRLGQAAPLADAEAPGLALRALRPSATEPPASETLLAETTGESARVDLDGAPSARRTVRVKFAHRPVVGAVVRVFDPRAHGGDLEPLVARTDGKGRARLQVPAARELVVEVEDRSDGLVVRREIVAPAARRSRTIVLDLGRIAGGRSLAFEVVSVPSGRPLSIPVSAHTVESEGRPRIIGRGRTDAAGRILLPWRRDGAVYAAGAPGHAAWSRTIFERPDGEPVIRAELLEHARVFGVLAPRRTADPQSGSIRRFVRLCEGPHVRIVRGSTSTVDVERNGGWRKGIEDFDGPDAALVDVSVLAYHGATSRVVATGLTIRPGDSVEVFDGASGVRLEVLQRARTRWTSGLELAFVPSGAQDYRPWLTTAVPSGGEVEIDRLPEGRWDVYAGDMAAPDVRDPVATIEHDGARDHTLTLPGFVPLTGTVLLPGGAPARWAALTLHVDGRSHRIQASSAGTYAFPIAREGTEYTLEVNGWRDDPHGSRLLRGPYGETHLLPADDPDRPPGARVDRTVSGEPITVQI